MRPDANAGLVALVTGGGSGIGRATALELAASGARVVVCDRREEPLARTRGEIESGGGECLDLSADLREPEQGEAWWAPRSIASARSTCSTTTPACTSRLPPRRSRRTAVPLDRLGRPEEVPGPIAFLASAGGAYITGTTIVVDGDAWGLAEPPPAPASESR